MRLLLINFAMDPASPVLAWQQRVALRLAMQVEHVTVLTGHRGKVSVPQNMEMHVVPRLFNRWPARALGAKRLMNFPVDRWCRRQRFDACFMHMNYEWSYLLAPTLRRWRIPVLLWYAHGTVTADLRRALSLVDRVVTSTPEGFRISSDKIKIIGQAVDTELFSLCEFNDARNDILYIGRVSKRKRIDLMIDTMSELKRQAPGSPIKLRIIGPTLNREDAVYLASMQERANRAGLQDQVEFCGARTQSELRFFYPNAFLHLNVSETGSMDKTVMEALAVGCPVLTSNEAIVPMLAGYFPEMVLADPRPEAIVRQILGFHRTRAELDPHRLRSLIVGRHDLASYTDKIIGCLHEIVQCGRSADL